MATLRTVLRASLLPVASLGATLAWSQVNVVQTLDQAKVFGGPDVVAMPFNDPYREADSGSVINGISWPGGFVACKQTSAAGLICLTNDEWVVRWPDPSNPTGAPKLFSCNGVDKLLDERAPNTCTGLTADESGVIWLAGKNKGKTHSLVKVTAGACGSTNANRQNVAGQSATFCAETWDTGRPLLLDVSRFEGQPARHFTSIFPDGETIVGLEQRLNAVLFSATHPNTYAEIPGGKSGWSLANKELLQSIVLLQREFVTVSGKTYKNYVLVTTSNGRVLAKDTDNLSAPAFQVHQETNVGCSAAAAPQYALRASPKGGIVYLANRNCFRAVALQAVDATSPPAPGPFTLAPATEDYFDLDQDGEPVGSVQTREVPPLSTASTAPEGLTVAPGEDFSLADCGIGETCRLVQGATVSNIVYSGDPAVTLYQIKYIPDCRWIPRGSWPVECSEAAIADLQSAGTAAGQYLNVEPLLPLAVKDALTAKGVVLPGQLLIAPQFRGQQQNGYRFEAFFAVVDPNVTFSGTFDGEFDALVLAGAELGCLGTYGTTRWDVVTKVSERFSSVDGRYLDLLLNTGCGSSAIKSQGFSLFSYNLEVTPDTYLPGRMINGVPDPVVEDNDAVFARLLEKLFHDLDYVANNLACRSGADAAASRPISTTKCTTLLSNLANAGDKLGKCIVATYQPKQSASNQNCTAFVEQFRSFRDTLAVPDTGLVGTDPANRVGEVDVRAQVLLHVYETRFVPSIPDGGFCEETDPTHCPRAN